MNGSPNSEDPGKWRYRKPPRELSSGSSGELATIPEPFLDVSKPALPIIYPESHGRRIKVGINPQVRAVMRGLRTRLLGDREDRHRATKAIEKP
jgi:hypothetical protein